MNGGKSPNTAKPSFGKSASKTPAMPMASKVQIKALEAQRPKPTIERHYTPGGSVQQYAYSEAVRKKNAEITKLVNKMETRLKTNQNKAKEAFEKSRGGFVRNTFNRTGRGNTGPSR